MNTQAIPNMYPERTVDYSSNFAHQGIPLPLQQLAALVILLILSPFIAIVMLLISLESPGGIIFKQVRIGEYGRHFTMYKFRSMFLKTDSRYQEPQPTASDRQGVCKKYINDPRVTNMGKFIRKFSVDELPQLINVIKGDMCLIGPRPALAIETYQYRLSDMARLVGKPGLTGLWQVSGRANTNFEQQMALDTHYLDTQSIINDFTILLKTIPAVLGAKGAY
jgi:exopolysaccharide production protein ExoY|tara:strand:- start:7589 stop:8254 length:666 start_codon:yes stop_codon:yes gene_type:complete